MDTTPAFSQRRPVKRPATAPERAEIIGAALALGGLHAARVALLDAGAAPAELPVVCGVDVRREGELVVVDLPGGVGPGGSPIAPRMVVIAAWAAPAVEALALACGAGSLLYRGSSNDPASQVASVLMSVCKALDLAGVDRASVKPASLPLGAARRAFDDADTHHLEAAAWVLGSDNLDRVADGIGVDLVELFAGIGG